ncbi:MAG: hypothetical protein KAR19_01915 [Bacteroidales bacterium]|nr:hypothetical protein [Bacteroidales bacterium]
MKSRTRISPVITIMAIAAMACIGFFSTNCERIEPERLIIIKASTVSEVTRTSCTVAATLFDVGPSGVNQHGFCWSLTPDPAEAINCTQMGSKKAKGKFNGVLTGLNPGTPYHVWAYASNGDVKVYGKSQSFNTLSVELPHLETAGISSITSNSAGCGGNIISDGGAEITARGVCWNISGNPTIEQTHTTDGSGAGDYGSNILELSPDTKYYVRAYATNTVGTAYGNEQSFTTLSGPGLPQVVTNGVEEITSNSAHCGGSISNDGGAEITSKGLCWSVSPEPTLANFSNVAGTGTGEFSIQMTDLLPETEYFVRAYATNSAGTAYGNEQIFGTLPEPVVPLVVTNSVEGIESTSVTCGGSISDDGGSAIISKGFCWSTDPNPTLSDSYNVVGSGPEPFTIEISDLAPDTEYFVRAYATNSVGTGYGNQQEFRTLFICGTQFVDKRNGQLYLTVSIGDQCWMAENLNIGERIAFPARPGDNVTIEKYCYDDDDANCDLYGGQYTWDEMMQYTQVEMAQGVCPDGWHIPSDHEWKILERSLGMTEEESNGTQWRGSNEGGKLKAAGTAYWNDPNEGATNSSLFTALPSGFLIHDGSFSGLGYFTVFWTSTPILETQAWYRMLDADHSQIYRIDGYRPNTTPVRCVKD